MKSLNPFRLRRTGAWSFLLATLIGTSAWAETVLFKASTVHPVSGPALAPGQVLVRDGKIVEVAKVIPTAADRTVDLGSFQLFPGLIAADTDLGLTEISSVRGSVDINEVGDFAPDVTSWVAFNPDSELVAVARANGITHAHVVPGGGVVAGQSGLLALSGWTWEEMSVRRPVAMHVRWPNMELSIRTTEGGKKGKPLDEQSKERAKKLKALDDFFTEAEAYDHARAADPKLALVPAWEAMRPVVRKELPLVVHADDVREIKSAVAWAERRGYRMILSGGQDAAQVAALLAAKKVPVIYSRVWAQPERQQDSYDAQFAAPAALVKAGVLTAIMQGGARMQGAAWSLRNLPYAAAQAMAFGLPEADALKSITLNPAQMLGVGDRLGSLEPGKEATFIAVDGNILDLRANVKRMWVAGKEENLESRHTRLYEKFKARPKP